MVGNKHLLRCDDMWQKLLQHFERRECITNANMFLGSQNRIIEPMQQRRIALERERRELEEKREEEKKKKMSYTAHEQQSRYPRQQRQQAAAANFRQPQQSYQGQRRGEARPRERNAKPTQDN